jgi:branched-chain amino acid transport system substrate-binding protein
MRKVLRKTRVATAFAGALAVVLSVAFLGSGTGTAASSPVTIGISLSLSGDFSTDGVAFERGYQLWEADQNKAGGLLGHPVKLDILSDASSPTQVVTNYNTLIGSHHDQLVFGPFSTLLTVPASKVVARYGYAFVEGAGGAPSAFGNGLHDIFDVSVPVALNLTGWAKWAASLPASERPKTAAYPTSTDPFTQPQLPPAQSILQAAGVKTVYSGTFPAEVADYTSVANQIARKKPDAVVLGSVDVPTVSAFIHAFIQQHYSPKFFIATAGPDQGAAFIQAIGKGNENGIFVPNGWYGGSPKADSQQMVKEYIAKYGGTASEVNADVAEAYSVGQVVAQAVAATKGFNNAKIIAYLHGNVTLNSVQGPVKFNAAGENTALQTTTFQWQNGNLVPTIPVGQSGTVKPLVTKPNWSS